MKLKLACALGILATLSLAIIALGGFSNAEENELDKGDELTNSFGPRGVVTLVEDDQNIAASELMGTWVPALEVSTALLPPGAEMTRESGFSQTLYTYTFKESQVATERMQAHLEVVLAELREDEREKEKVPSLERACQALYLTGEVTISRNEEEMLTADFALVSFRGNPHLIYLDSDGGTESQNIMLARDEDGDADVLWIGGDFNNQDMSPLIRKEHAERLRVVDDETHVHQIDLKHHLLSQNIWGAWELHADITNLVAGEETQLEVESILFERDKEATEKIIAAFEEMAGMMKQSGAQDSVEVGEALRALSRVYASGRMTTTMTQGETVTEFALVNMYGSPMIAWNRRDGKVQFLRIQYVNDADGENDLLFISTDLPEDTPQAYMRKKK